MARPSFVVAGFGTSVALCFLALYAALFVGHACGDEGVAPPSTDSPKAAVCEFWTHPDNRVSLLLGVLFYGPVVLPILGGVWTARSGRGTAYWCSTVASVVVFATHVFVATALPG